MDVHFHLVFPAKRLISVLAFLKGGGCVYTESCNIEGQVVVFFGAWSLDTIFGPNSAQPDVHYSLVSRVRPWVFWDTKWLLLGCYERLHSKSSEFSYHQNYTKYDYVCLWVDRSQAELHCHLGRYALSGTDRIGRSQSRGGRYPTEYLND